jgi:hypothetical protein
VCLVGILVLPACRCALWGWIRQEPCYKGLPASYWEHELLAWSHEDPYRRAAWNFYKKQLFGGTSPLWPAVLDGDPEAVPVLQELLHSKESWVREAAASALADVKKTGNGHP